MEGSSSTDPSPSTSPSASKLLTNLPSRGLFSSSSTVVSSNPEVCCGSLCFDLEMHACPSGNTFPGSNHSLSSPPKTQESLPLPLSLFDCIKFIHILLLYLRESFVLTTKFKNIVFSYFHLQGGMRVYICDHDTSPPEDQVIRTDQQNIMIRSLMIKKRRGDSSSKSGKGAAIIEVSRKRASERLSDAASAKRPNTQEGSQQEGSHTHLSDKDLHTLTVERLRALLKEKGLSAKGKKDELIARLKG